MIRAITIGSLVTVLMLVLYLPSSQPPEHFIAQLRQEHERNLAFWGEATAERIFDRMIRLQDGVQTYSPEPTAAAATGSHQTQTHTPTPPLTHTQTHTPTGAGTGTGTGTSPVPLPLPTGVSPAVQQEMARVNARLFNNSYFRAIDALLALASYRLATLAQWCIPSGVIILALLADGMLIRALKAKELRHHSPELFAVFTSLVIVTLCACTLALVWPWSLPSVAWAAVPSGVAWFLAQAIAQFHRRAS